MNRLLISVVASLCVFSATTFAQVRELPSPAGTGSGQPNLAVSPDGRTYLSWIERMGEGRFSLRFATLEKDGWSTPRVIADRATAPEVRFVVGIACVGLVLLNINHTEAALGRAPNEPGPGVNQLVKRVMPEVIKVTS